MLPPGRADLTLCGDIFSPEVLFPLECILLFHLIVEKVDLYGGGGNLLEREILQCVIFENFMINLHSQYTQG